MTISWKKIHWFDVRGMSIRLRDGLVSRNEAFQHLLIYTAIAASGAYFPIRANGILDGPLGWLPTIGLYLAAVIVNLYGLSRTYRINESGDDKDYFLRLSALSLCVGLRVLLVSLFPLIIVMFVVSHYELAHSEFELTIGIFTVFVSIYYYWVLTNAFRVAAGDAT